MTCTRHLTDDKARRARDPPSMLDRSGVLSLNLNEINEETLGCMICWDEIGPEDSFHSWLIATINSTSVALHNGWRDRDTTLAPCAGDMQQWIID
jgi:hypothetical protein